MVMSKYPLLNFRRLLIGNTGKEICTFYLKGQFSYKERSGVTIFRASVKIVV